MLYNNIYDLITAEENAYNTAPITVIDGLDFSMPDHIRTTILYKNSTYKTGKDDNKPYKNIIRPILNLQYRAEGFDVKDIQLFVNDVKNYYKSFLVKKYHEKWARENKIDNFIDEMVESYVDFGGALVKDINQVRPEVVPLQRIVFCDQTDILKGTIAEKHFFAPDELREMANQGWGDESKGATGTIEEVITLADNYKKSVQNYAKENKTPGKYIEVYEVHGMFPDYWLSNEVYQQTYDEEAPENKYTRQLHIVTFYKDSNGNQFGICLFKGKEAELPYKLVLRDKIYGRALGFGGAEELFEPQVWTNYDVIRIKEMLDVASKIIFQTADDAYASRNKTTDLDNGEILVHEDGKPLSQINTAPVNITVFENSIAEWQIHAKEMGSAGEAILGEAPSAGTPFASLQLQVNQAQSLHEYRKGKLATFLDEVYQDWIIPYLAKEITQGQQFLSELNLDELQQVADALVINSANDIIKEKILNGETIDDTQIESYKQRMRDEFMKGGNKKFLEIFKNEFKNAPIDIEINIAGKQANLSGITDKLTNIFRTVIQSPQILQTPQGAKLFNQILESSGLSPLDFTGFISPTEKLMQSPKIEQSNMPALANMVK